MHKVCLGLLWLYLILNFWGTTFASEKLRVTDQNTGLTWIEDPAKNLKLQVFPENRLGNTVYQNEVKIYSKKNLAIQGVKQVFAGLIFKAKNKAGDFQLLYFGNGKTEFVEVIPGFWQMVMKDLRKFYRIDPNQKIQDILSYSKSANGIVGNAKGDAAFFHVLNGEIVKDEKGDSIYEYTFKIHLIKNNSKSRISIKETVNDVKPFLKLNWNGDKLLYTLSDGSVHGVKLP